MADPVASPETEREGTHPIFIVAGTVLVVVVVSFLIYSVGGSADDAGVFAAGQTGTTSPAATGACGFGSPDDSYSVAVASDPDPPRAEGTTFRLTVRQADRTVTGAKVCIKADMPDMQHPGTNAMARELSGGRYEARMKFSMGGSWKASVTIAEPGKPIVQVTVPIEVSTVVED